MNGRILGVDALNAVPPGRILVVTPTYNEVGNIAAFVRAVAGTGADLLIVDDASPDGTAEAARSAALQAPMRVWLMRRPRKLGLGTAYVDAFGWALQQSESYCIFVGMDADFSHDPALVPKLAQAAERGGVAVGSRYVVGGSTPDWPLRRRWLSAWANRYARWILGLRFRHFRVRDATSGFVAWRRDAAARILSRRPSAKGYAFLIETKLFAVLEGFAITELPITFTDRTRGASKISRMIIIESALLPWRKLFRP